ncbi:MAG: hypothetical protein MJ247_01770 [Alphaproteobacteria bacterium]|nr:hypothetical protein [Alphaproteobacteria bacterium]
MILRLISFLVFTMFSSFAYGKMPENAIKCLGDWECPNGWFCYHEDEDYYCKQLCLEPKTKSGEICEGITPACFESQTGHDSYCGCVDDSCPSGMICKGTKCVPCPKGYVDYDNSSCNCPPGRAANGKGSCGICGPHQNCHCPDKKVTNGEGNCVTCVSGDDCGDYGFKCINPGKFDSSCGRLVCEEGEYIKGNECVNCPEGCGACENEKVCTKGAPGYFIIDGKPYNCPVGLGEGCAECSGFAAKVCDKCKIGFEKNENNYCVRIQCPDDSFLVGDSCVKCSDLVPNCHFCDSETQCKVCNLPGYQLSVDKQCVCHDGYHLAQDGVSCEIDKCDFGKFHNGNGCANCIEGCNVCQDQFQCMLCDEYNGYQLVNNICQKVFCPVGTYRSGIDCPSCSSAMPNCTECSENGKICNSCMIGFKLKEDNSGCEPIVCKDNEYLLGNDCLSCSEKYSFCSRCNQFECLECDKFYINKIDHCELQTCLPKHYLSEETLGCELCPVGTNPSADLRSCEPIVCPDGQYLFEDSCVDCHESCATCSSSADCDTCKPGLGRYEDSDYCEVCKLGYYLEDEVCYTCDTSIPGCEECSSDGKVCMDCGKYKISVLNKCIIDDKPKKSKAKQKKEDNK